MFSAPLYTRFGHALLFAVGFRRNLVVTPTPAENKRVALGSRKKMDVAYNHSPGGCKAFTPAGLWEEVPRRETPDWRNPGRGRMPR